MRVSLTRETTQQKDGLFKKKTYFGVLLQVEFSEEELAIIKENDLGATEILEVGLDPIQFKRVEKLIQDGIMDVNDPVHNLRIKDLVPEKRKKKAPVWSRQYPSKLEADQLEANIREKLPELKNYIMANGGEVKEGTESFEL